MNKWIAGTLCLCLLVACSKDDNEAGGQTQKEDNAGAEVGFSSSVITSVIDNIVGDMTRAPINELGNNEKIGIFGIPAIEGNDNIDCNMCDKSLREDFQENLYNEPYTYVSGYDNLQTVNRARFPKGNKAALALYSYYPYTENVSRQEFEGKVSLAIPWKLNIDDMRETADYMYTGQVFKAYSEVGTQPICLQLRHAMARMDFCFYTTSLTLAQRNYDIVSVQMTALIGEEGYMSLEDGSLSSYPKFIGVNDLEHKNGIYYPIPNGISMAYSDPNETPAKVGSPVASFILPPNAVVNSIIYNVRDGWGKVQPYEVYTYNSNSPANTISFKAGCITKLQVNFQPKEISVSGAEVKAWETDENKCYDVSIKIQ